MKNVVQAKAPLDYFLPTLLALKIAFPLMKCILAPTFVKLKTKAK